MTRTVTLYMVKADGVERYLQRYHQNTDPLGSAHSGITYVGIEAARRAVERWQGIGGAKLSVVRVTMTIEVGS